MQVTSTYCDQDDCYNQVEEMEEFVARDAGWHCFKRQVPDYKWKLYEYHAVCFHCAEMYGEQYLKEIIDDFTSEGWEYMKPGNECYNPDCTNWCHPKTEESFWGNNNCRESDSTCSPECHATWMASAS